MKAPYLSSHRTSVVNQRRPAACLVESSRNTERSLELVVVHDGHRPARPLFTDAVDSRER